MRPTSAQLVTILEAAYAVDLPRAEFLSGVLAALQPVMDDGMGVSAYFVDVSQPGAFEASGFQGVGAEREEDFQQWNRPRGAVWQVFRAKRWPPFVAIRGRATCAS